MTDKPNSATSDRPPSGAPIASLERDVALANRAFSESLHDASEAGLQAASRVGQAIRPVLIGVAVLGGAVLLLQLVLRTRRASSVRVTSPRARRPLWAELARSVASAAAMAGVRRLVPLLLERREVSAPTRQALPRHPG